MSADSPVPRGILKCSDENFPESNTFDRINELAVPSTSIPSVY